MPKPLFQAILFVVFIVCGWHFAHIFFHNVYEPLTFDQLMQQDRASVFPPEFYWFLGSLLSGIVLLVTFIHEAEEPKKTPIESLTAEVELRAERKRQLRATVRKLVDEDGWTTTEIAEKTGLGVGEIKEAYSK